MITNSLSITFIKNIIKKKYFPLFLFILFTLISLFLSPGYEVFAYDQQRYIPPIYQMMDSELYQNDLGTKSPQTNFTIFDEFIYILLKITHLDMFTLLFILTVISFYFTNNKYFSIFVPVLFITNHGAFGTAVSTMDFELHPRAIALILNLVFLLLYVKGKRFYSSIFLGLGLWMHAITTAPFLAIYYIHLFFFNKKRKIINKESIFLSLIPILLLAFFMGVLTPRGTFSLFSTIDSSWKEIILDRTPYVFLFTSISLSTIDLIIDTLMMGSFWFISKNFFINSLTKEKKDILNLLLFIPLCIFIGSAFLVDIFQFHFFASLQLGRVLFLWKILLPIMFLFYVVNKIKENPKDFFNNFIMIGILLSFIVSEKIILIFIPIFFLSWIYEKLNGHLKNLNPMGKITSNNKIKFFQIIKKIFTKNILSFLFILLVIMFLVGTKIIGEYKDISNYNFNTWLLLIIVFSFLISLFFLYNQNRAKKMKIIVLILIIGIVCTFYFYKPLSVERKVLQDESFSEMCEWIKGNTMKSEMFLTEPFSTPSSDIRLLCFRNIYFSQISDGAVVIFKRDLSFEWKRRFDISKELFINPNITIMKQESINYVLSENNLILLNEYIVFQNERYYIYKIPLVQVANSNQKYLEENFNLVKHQNNIYDQYLKKK